MAGRTEGWDELVAIARLASRTGSPPAGEVWLGDDTAVISGRSRLLFATDVLVEGVHFRRDLGTLADAGWKALVTNLSDVAAMGGEPLAAVVALVGASKDDLDQVYDGLLDAASKFACPIVGGDLSDGPELVLSVALLGSVPEGTTPVLRSGGRAGDAVFLTGPVGAAAAGLRALLADSGAEGAGVDAHRRPVPRLLEGRAAARAGATAMIDVSDGLGIDLDRICVASGVGVALDRLWVAIDATDADALGGGDDYELLFTSPAPERVRNMFREAGRGEPMEIGVLTNDPTERSLAGRSFEPHGYRHELS